MLFVHPDQPRLKLVRIVGRLAGVHQDVAAGDVDLTVEDERHGLSGHGFIPIPIHGDDAGDDSGFTRGGNEQFVANLHQPRRDRA